MPFASLRDAVGVLFAFGLVLATTFYARGETACPDHVKAFCRAALQVLPPLL